MNKRNKVETQRNKIETEKAFRYAARLLLNDIRGLRKVLAGAEAILKDETIGLATDEKNERYVKNIMPYLDGLDELSGRYASQIDKTARHIKHVADKAMREKPPKQAKKIRRKLWLRLASALEPLAGRPSKKVVALLVSTKNELVAWDSNHLAYGVRRNPSLYVKDVNHNRGAHLWCAERNVLGQYLGMAALVPPTNAPEVIHAALEKYTHSLIGAAIHSKELKGLSLVSSHALCTACGDVYAPMFGQRRVGTVKEIIALWNRETESALTSPSRRTKEAQRILRSSGTPVHISHDHKNCTLH